MGSIPISGAMVLSNIIKDKYIRVLGGLSLLILILTGIIFYLGLGSITAPLVIHFDTYRGIDFLGSPLQAFGIIISAFVIILINLLLANFLYSRERFLSYIFTFVSFDLAILILIAISVIISVN